MVLLSLLYQLGRQTLNLVGRSTLNEVPLAQRLESQA